MPKAVVKKKGLVQLTARIGFDNESCAPRATDDHLQQHLSLPHAMIFHVASYYSVDKWANLGLSDVDRTGTLLGGAQCRSSWQ
jgi:hypothetical protein